MWDRMVFWFLFFVFEAGSWDAAVVVLRRDEGFFGVSERKEGGRMVSGVYRSE